MRAKTLPSDKLGTMKRRAKKEGWLKYIRSEADERAMLAGCRFDIARAEHVERFFSRFLRHSQGDFAGKPFELQPWQRDDLFYPLFGWVKVNERGKTVRRFRKAYVEIPKKNGKSTIASGVGLYMLVADGEEGAEIYSAASDRNQASIVHREAINMVENSPELSNAVRINRSTWNIAYPKSKSFYRSLASKPENNEGFKAHCIIGDELHTWTGEKGRALYDALRWAFASRTQPLFFQITTAGEDPLSVCGEQHDYAKQIIEGTTFDENYFAYIRAADPEDDPMSEATWVKANPSLGTTITFESFRSDAIEASKTPSALARFKRYRLDIWTTGDDAWLPITAWDANKRPFSDQSLEGQICYAGLDLSRTTDTTSLQLVFPPENEGDDYRLISRFWLPEEKARELDGIVPFLLWAKQGLITLTPGNVVDYAFIEREIGELAKRFQIAKLAYDMKYAEDVTQRIEANFGIPRFTFPQTIMHFAGPTAEFERLVIATKQSPAVDSEIVENDLVDLDEIAAPVVQQFTPSLLHNGHEIMRWQVGNARVRCDASGNKRPLKPNNAMDHRKIDGVVAAIMALALALEHGFTQHGSYYDEHELESD